MATSTVETILETTLTSASDILTVNLPTIFTFLLVVTAIWFVFRKVRKGMKGR